MPVTGTDQHNAACQDSITHLSKNDVEGRYTRLTIRQSLSCTSTAGNCKVKEYSEVGSTEAENFGVDRILPVLYSYLNKRDLVVAIALQQKICWVHHLLTKLSSPAYSAHQRRLLDL